MCSVISNCDIIFGNPELCTLDIFYNKIEVKQKYNGIKFYTEFIQLISNK